MAAALFRLIPLAAGVAIFIYWIYCLVRYNPDMKPCDGDCESCPFPSTGCNWKDKEE